MTTEPGVDPSVPPSGTGCAECDASGGWWVHLRRCTQCGHIGCCDSSPSQHASAHAAATGHPVIRSFEPGESWFWNFRTQEMYESGPALAPRSTIRLISRYQARQAASRPTGHPVCTSAGPHWHACYDRSA